MSNSILKVIPRSPAGILGWKGIGTFKSIDNGIIIFTDDADVSVPKVNLYAHHSEVHVGTRSEVTKSIIDNRISSFGRIRYNLFHRLERGMLDALY